MWARRQAASPGGRPGCSHRTRRVLAGRAGGWGWRRSRRVSPPAPGVHRLERAGRSRGAGPAATMRPAASLVEVDWESMPAPAARAAVLLPQERSEAHRPPCSTRRETSRACHPSAPADEANSSAGHTPRTRGCEEAGRNAPPTSRRLHALRLSLSARRPQRRGTAWSPASQWRTTRAARLPASWSRAAPSWAPSSIGLVIGRDDRARRAPAQSLGEGG